MIEHLLNFIERMLNLHYGGCRMTASTEQEPSRRDKLVEATVAIILEVGLRAAKTRSVTERAGVGTGLLNHYFRWPELRALAWAQLFTAVTQDQFAGSGDPQEDLDRYFSTAFTQEVRRYWQLWIEASDLAASDGPMNAAFRRVSAQSRNRLRDLLRAGCVQGLWDLPAPDATALRLGAMHDGLAGLLLSPVAELDPARAEAHLRKAFALECQNPRSRAGQGTPSAPDQSC